MMIPSPLLDVGHMASFFSVKKYDFDLFWYALWVGSVDDVRSTVAILIASRKS
jgi:hypothetical protein